mmetsp:Transcript_72869/g.122719  ORF Transcript_72869/g.122719 Transcript_72869/m.122719 type:complete len:211 (-) Transcript_72869:2113-2745(-)
MQEKRSQIMPRRQCPGHRRRPTVWGMIMWALRTCCLGCWQKRTVWLPSRCCSVVSTCKLPGSRWNESQASGPPISSRRSPVRSLSVKPPRMCWRRPVTRPCARSATMWAQSTCCCHSCKRATALRSGCYGHLESIRVAWSETCWPRFKWTRVRLSRTAGPEWRPRSPRRSAIPASLATTGQGNQGTREAPPSRTSVPTSPNWPGPDSWIP